MKPKTDGFSYRQRDTDIYFDPKIRLLLNRFGCDGLALYDYICDMAFRENGYYLVWNEERQELASADLFVPYEKIGLIMDYLVRRSLLTAIDYVDDSIDTSRTAVKVLSSHGIQKRFQKMAAECKRGHYIFRKAIWLLSEAETLNSVFCNLDSLNSGINTLNSGIKPQSKVKKSKVNKEEKEINLFQEEKSILSEIQPPFDSALIAKAKELAKGKGNEEAYALAVLNDWRKRGIEKLSDFPQAKTGKKIDFAISTREYTKEELDKMMQDNFDRLDELFKGDNENDERRTTRA